MTNATAPEPTPGIHGALRGAAPRSSTGTGMCLRALRSGTVMVAAAAALVVGCSSGATGADVNAALQARAEVYRLIQEGNYAGIYDSYLSERCKDKVGKNSWISQTRAHNAGRDFSGPEQTSGAASGDRVIVQVTAYDGTPTTKQTFILADGRWVEDVC